MRIAGNALQAKQRGEIEGIVEPLVFEGKQRRRFEGKHAAMRASTRGISGAVRGSAMFLNSARSERIKLSAARCFRSSVIIMPNPFANEKIRGLGKIAHNFSLRTADR